MSQTFDDSLFAFRLSRRALMQPATAAPLSPASPPGGFCSVSVSPDGVRAVNEWSGRKVDGATDRRRLARSRRALSLSQSSRHAYLCRQPVNYTVIRCTE